MFGVRITLDCVIYGTLESYRYTGPSVVRASAAYLDSIKEGGYVQIIHEVKCKSKFN
jgi:hypothetical protein